MQTHTMKKNLLSHAAFLLLTANATGAQAQTVANNSANQNHRPLQIARQGVFS